MAENTVPRVMTGARAKLAISIPNSDETKVIGIFNSVSYGVVNDVAPAYILGQYAPGTLEYTAQEPVRVQATGWRVIGAGPYKSLSFPQLQKLIERHMITLEVMDRKTQQVIARISHCLPESFGTGLNARQMEEIQVSFIGILFDDEETIATQPNVDGDAVDFGAPDLDPSAT